MIAYLYLKSNNRIVHIIKEVVSITETDVVGKQAYAKGNDFSVLGVFCVPDNGTTLEIGSILPVESLVNLKNEIIIKTVRATRNSLLSTCDWTQLPDASLSDLQKETWREYRQALRDLPSVVDLENVVYPTQPEVI